MEEQSGGKKQVSVLDGDTIHSVDVEGGGSMFCRRVMISFKSGKTLCITPDLNVGNIGIQARLEYHIGSWGEIKNNSKS